LQTSFTSEGKIRIYDPVHKNETLTDIPNTIGSAKCSKEDQTKCELVGVGMADSGTFEGNYELPSALTANNEAIADINRNNVARRSSNVYQGTASFRIDENNNTVTVNGGRRRLAADSTSINNPVVCTVSGSAMLFDSLS
jgi:hypothetical protein